MKKANILNETQDLASNELIKVTSLLYFKEALMSQEFETCKELLAIARKAGAVQGDIDGVVSQFLDGYRAAGSSGASQSNNRLRVLKEGS